jgi:hypothetical protein
MTSNRLPNYLLIIAVINEIPEQLGLEGTHSSKMVKMMLKNSSDDPKLKYFRIPNYSENDYVTVLNCSPIWGNSL